MTKEELKKEAEEWLCNNLHSASEEDFIKAMVDIAEPREKRIAELEEQNTSLLTSVENLNKSVQELEKENAELKEKYAKNITDCDICDTYCNSQLTKATKIIKELCGMVRELNKPNVQLTNVDYSLSEAEQFISEVEK